MTSDPCNAAVVPGREALPVSAFLRAAALGMVMLAGGVHAQQEISPLRLSGFGTFGYAGSNRGDMAAIRDISQRPDDGSATRSSWKLDSRIAVQADYKLSPTAELVGQAVLRDHVSATPGNSIEAAYAAWHPKPQLDLRLGRLGYDAFLMSDTRNLGYAYSWVRPPVEFYGWIPIFSIDGVDAAYTVDTEDAHWRIKAQIGRSGFATPMGAQEYDFKTNRLWSLTLSRQSGPWRAKVGYSGFIIDSEAQPLAPLHAGLGAVAAAGVPGISAEAGTLLRHLSFKGTRISYLTAGLAYDDGDWLVQGELGRSTATADVVPHGTMAYLGVGRRFGDWTPYLVASAVRPGNGVRTAASDWSAIGQGGLQNTALYVVNTTRMDQSTLSLGVRWDLHNQAALKLQWDRTSVRPSGYGLWFHDIALEGRSTHVDLLSLSLDFVF